jgi:hypothetical protein
MTWCGIEILERQRLTVWGAVGVLAGFVMSMYTLLRSRDGKVKMAEVQDGLRGNLCRCTGYGRYTSCVLPQI